MPRRSILHTPEGLALPLAVRVRITLQRAISLPIVAALRRAGLQERLVAARRERRRRQRAELEAKGSDRLSHPAQHGLDVKIAEIVDVERGFFIEAGANDGYAQSNTYWLEKFRGWDGLLVEPMPELADEARLNRNVPVFQCALVPAGHAGDTVRMRFGDLMSSLEGARDASYSELGALFGFRDSYVAEVPARTLSSILDEAGSPEVDLLSLDVEGFEASALAGLDLNRHAPRFILVEIVDENVERPAIDEVLGDRYVEHSWLSPRDLLYMRRAG